MGFSISALGIPAGQFGGGSVQKSLSIGSFGLTVADSAFQISNIIPSSAGLVVDEPDTTFE